MFFTKILLLFRKKYVAIAISFLIEGGIPVVTPAKTGKIVPNVMCAGRPSANIYANIVTTREYLNIAY